MDKNNNVLFTARNIVVILILLVILAGALIYSSRNEAPEEDNENNNIATSTLDQSISDGFIKINYPEDFGLAVEPNQILVESYIPPCDQNFDYCFYFIGNDFEGTNFESAGLRILKRTNFSTERICLNTPPAGFDASVVPTATTSSETYTTSVFENVGSAGAGHFASGELYRLFDLENDSCYEFETRVGQSQFANYPEGAIEEFTESDQTQMRNKISDILDNITLTETSEKIEWP